MRVGILRFCLLVPAILFTSSILVFPNSSIAAKWSLQKVVLPKGASEAEFSAISCAGPKWCIAVGRYVNSSSVRVSLAELWNGTEWKQQSTPDPSGSLEDGFLGVSCIGNAGPAECVAVGGYRNSKTRLAFAEYFNKTSWALRTIPTPTGARATELTSVSCTSPGGCHAAGGWYNKENNKVTFASSSTNSEFTTWNSEEPANQASPQNELLGISCRSSSSCNAVGTYFTEPEVGRHTLAEHWTGTKWELTTTEKGTETTLYGVSCDVTCMAVGGSHEPLAEKEGIKTTTVSKGEGSIFRGVSCPAEKTCYAVGDYAESPTIGLLAETWNGTTWTNQEIPNAGLFSELYGISCPEVNVCFAVGYSKTSEKAAPVAAAYS
jgi:hypothetical protein